MLRLLRRSASSTAKVKLVSQRFSKSSTGRREVVATSASQRAPMGKLSQPPSPAPIESAYYSSAMEIFLNENPYLKPFLMSSHDKERASIECAIVWSEVCDKVSHSMRACFCKQLAAFRSPREKRVRNETSEHNEPPGDGYETLRIPENCFSVGGSASFSREFAPFFFFFQEPVIKSAQDIYLENLEVASRYKTVCKGFSLHAYIFHHRISLISLGSRITLSFL